MAIISILVSACQSTSPVSSGESSGQVTLTVSEQDIGRDYFWGGEILEITNLKKTTELTVLGYPLDKYNQPDDGETSNGRFIAVYSGFLEPTDYRKGRLVTVSGELIDVRRGNVDNAEYDYPILSVEDIALHKRKPRGFFLPFSIGIGIGIHN